MHSATPPSNPANAQSNTARALVIFSGGQDSTTCLIQAINDYGAAQVEAITFTYGQRHAIELECASKILQHFNIKQTLLDLSLLQQVTTNALMDSSAPIEDYDDAPPNTLVEGRNALFLLYAAIYAKSQGIQQLIIGVSEADSSGYPDCRQAFIQSMENTLQLAMNFPFKIHAPLMQLTKAQTWALADQLQHLEFVRDYSHTCYEGVKGGCHQCPSCLLREKGLAEYLAQRSASTAKE